MSNFAALATITLLVLIVSVSVEEPWRLTSNNVLIGTGRYNNSDHFEIIASEGCDAFELRIWARIFDTDSNLLGFDDNVKLSLTLGNDLVASQASVLYIAADFSENFDLIYLSLGSWDWKTLQMVSSAKAKMFVAHFTDERAALEDNTWQVANLPQILAPLRLNCFSQSAGGFMEALNPKPLTLYEKYT